MSSSDRLVRTIERESRGVSLTPEQIESIVIALVPCCATQPVVLTVIRLPS